MKKLHLLGALVVVLSVSSTHVSFAADHGGTASVTGAAGRDLEEALFNTLKQLSPDDLNNLGVNLARDATFSCQRTLFLATANPLQYEYPPAHYFADSGILEKEFKSASAAKEKVFFLKKAVERATSPDLRGEFSIALAPMKLENEVRKLAEVSSEDFKRVEDEVLSLRKAVLNCEISKTQNLVARDLRELIENSALRRSVGGECAALDFLKTKNSALARLLPAAAVCAAASSAAAHANDIRISTETLTKMSGTNVVVVPAESQSDDQNPYIQAVSASAAK